MCINFPYFESASLELFGALTLAVCYSPFIPLCSPVAKQSQLIFCIEENNSDHLRWQMYSFLFVILVDIRKLDFLSEIIRKRGKFRNFHLCTTHISCFPKLNNWIDVNRFYSPISFTHFIHQYLAILCSLLCSIADLSNLFPTVACSSEVCVLKSKSNWLTSK